MSDGEVFPVPADWAKNAIMGAAGYDAAVRREALDPDGYWADVGNRLTWITGGKSTSISADTMPLYLRVKNNSIKSIWPGREQRISNGEPWNHWISN